MTKFMQGAAIAAGLLFVSGSALAQEAQAPQMPEGKFEPAVAAKCAATFEWMLEFVNLGDAEGMDQQAVSRFYMETDLAAGMWTYELYAAMQDNTEEEVKNQFLAGAEALTADFPAEDSEGANEQVIETVMSSAGDCSQKIATAYPDGDHPVVAQFKAQAMQQMQQMQQQQGGAATPQPQGE